jgi:hypothetical protein
LNTLNVEYRKVEALIPYARNPRTHSDAQIAKIAASIVEYGWTNPVLVDGDNGIIAGHGRLAAARKLGLDQVPVIELAHLSTAQKRALVIADNRLALDAGWDEEMLALELAELSEAGYDLALTGFENIEIERCWLMPRPLKQNRWCRMKQMPTNPMRQTMCLMRQWCGVAPRRCLGHRLAPIDLWRRHRPAVVATLMQGDTARCASPRRPTATSATTPPAASPIGMA